MREADSPTVATYNNLQRTSPPPLAITATAFSLSSPSRSLSFFQLFYFLSHPPPPLSLFSHTLLPLSFKLSPFPRATPPFSPSRILHFLSLSLATITLSLPLSLSSVVASSNRLLSAQLDSPSISRDLISGDEEEARIMAMKGFLEPLVADMICDDPFDSIDDLLDFPNDEDDGLAMVESWGNGGAPLAPATAQPMIPAVCGGGASVGSATRGVDGRSIAVSGDVISSEADALCLYDEIDTANLEWLSNFFEDSDINLEFIAAASPDPKPRSSSPVSVLHPATLAAGAVTSSSSPCSSSSSSSSSSASQPTMSPPRHPAVIPVPGRARTKRPRLPSFSARTFVPPSSSVSDPCPAAGKKTKKDAEAAPSSPRRCTHCDVQKTPQWRAGPMGPKTLCNACGVRYKSGRLFPEYRPAVSPTFVPAVHSNSHRKVVEMRLRCTDAAGKNGRGQILVGTVAAKNCDLVEYIRRRD